MSAIIDTKKRLFSDIPRSPDFSSTKKLKLQSHTPIPNPPVGTLSPLRRLVHGPQRILRAFGLGSSRTRTRLVSKMGNFVSRLFKPGKEEEEESEGLGIEDYRELVKNSPCFKLGLGLSDLPAEKLGNAVCRQIGDARRIVESSMCFKLGLGLSDLSSEKLGNAVGRQIGDVRRMVESSLCFVKRPPAYKELFESANRRDPKLSSLAFEVALYEKKRSEFGVAQKSEDLHELFCPLTKEEEDDVLSAMCGGNRHELLVTHESSNIEITREVIQCLDRTAWLNDEVVNLYLELLKERERREPKRFLKCHFFNTFFYKKLSSGRNGYDFNSVRRWTSQRKLGYGLIECDKIFVPIHRDIHWCLAVINVKDQTFQYLDSLGGMDTRVLKILARYFMDEVKDKSGKNIDTTSWRQVIVDNLPLQKNGFDCGMFMLKYTDFYSRGLGLRFSQEHMGYFRKRTVKEILRLRAE